MLRVFPFATALAAVSAACYVLGALLALAAPGLFLAMLQSWVFLDLSALAAGGVLVTLDRFVIGLVTVTIWGWLFGAAWGLLYNVLSEAREIRA